MTCSPGLPIKGLGTGRGVSNFITPAAGAPWVPWASPGLPRLRRPACLCYALSKMDEKNKLYFGDNLRILCEYVTDASVDLIYLDPPFNSSATYNVLFCSAALQGGTCRAKARRYSGRRRIRRADHGFRGHLCSAAL